ncbi:peptidylprolyl isomerase [Collinsella sp. An2]|uniref:peptidylprolyl isomerase n=1 Tax=Collinsella sp. An2 TaxID=1965585 RepID=UPI000B38C408|nr:peptidylprolyl isomerase [Collinsella sp. An2]OUP10383.1 peptidylprolyl isomerase [Collinsella sp. An2]
MAMKKNHNKKREGAEGEKKPATKADFKREGKKALSKGAKYILVAIGVAAMLLSVTAMACSGVLSQFQSSDDDYTLTGGVAATVNGVNITEDTVTRQIMSTRSSMGYGSDEGWAQYLANSGMTPESYRENVINQYARQYLITQAEKEYDITVTQDDLDKAWDDFVANYDSEDKALETLTNVGYTKDTYLQSMESSLAQQKLRDKVAPEKDPTDDEIIEYVNDNIDTYNDARRSSHILIKVDSDADDATKEEARQKAQDILDKINNGEISFEDAAKEYSEDSSADDGGDVGWDKLTSFVTEYQDALSALSKDQISGVVESSYGFHIIKCTDYFHVDGEVTSIDQIPENLRDKLSDTITSNNAQTDYNNWLNDYVDAADIEINPMPENVPYNVDMSGVSSSTDEGSAQ